MKQSYWIFKNLDNKNGVIMLAKLSTMMHADVNTFCQLSQFHSGIAEEDYPGFCRAEE